MFDRQSSLPSMRSVPDCLPFYPCQQRRNAPDQEYIRRHYFLFHDGCPLHLVLFYILVALCAQCNTSTLLLTSLNIVFCHNNELLQEHCHCSNEYLGATTAIKNCIASTKLFMEAYSLYLKNNPPNVWRIIFCCSTTMLFHCLIFQNHIRL